MAKRELTQRELTHKQWLDEGLERFGDDVGQWAFVCPSCLHVATVADWRAAGATEGEIAFSCIGRRLEGARDFLDGKAGTGPCNYAGGGLFRLNPVLVRYSNGDAHEVFEFAGAVP